MPKPKFSQRKAQNWGFYPLPHVLEILSEFCVIYSLNPKHLYSDPFMVLWKRSVPLWRGAFRTECQFSRRKANTVGCYFHVVPLQDCFIWPHKISPGPENPKGEVVSWHCSQANNHQQRNVMHLPDFWVSDTSPPQAKKSLIPRVP